MVLAPQVPILHSLHSVLGRHATDLCDELGPKFVHNDLWQCVSMSFSWNVMFLIITMCSVHSPPYHYQLHLSDLVEVHWTNGSFKCRNHQNMKNKSVRFWTYIYQCQYVIFFIVIWVTGNIFPQITFRNWRKKL